MADRCGGVRPHASCGRGLETGELRAARRPLEISSQNTQEPVSLEELKKRSVLYRGEAPSSTFRDSSIIFSPTPVRNSQKIVEDRDVSVDWIDILGWTLSVGGGVASGFLIEKGLREDSTPIVATGEALATSALMWGIFEAAFRGTGNPHEQRWLRFGVTLGVGVATGLAVNYGSMKFDFNVDEHTYADDNTKAPFIFWPVRPPVFQPMKPITLPSSFFKGKHPTSEWGP